jgi:hypothetical protein
MANALVVHFTITVDDEELPDVIRDDPTMLYPDIEEYIQDMMDQHIPNIEDMYIDFANGIIHIELPEGMEIRGHVDIPEFETSYRGSVIRIVFEADTNEFYEGYTLHGSEEENAFMRAVIDGNAPAVEAALANVNPYVTTTQGEDAVIVAARRGHAPVLLKLLQRGLPVSIPVPFLHNITPLHMAAAGGYLAVVNMLLRFGAGPNVFTEEGHSPLYYAAYGGQTPIVEKLLTVGADPNTGDPLHAAASNGHAEIVAALLKAGAQISDNIRAGLAISMYTPAIAVLLEDTKMPVRSMREFKLPANAFDPIMAEEMSFGDASADEDRAIFIVMNDQNKPQYAATLDSASLEQYLTSKDNKFYKCRPEVPQGALQIIPENVFLTPYRRLNFSSRIYVDDSLSMAIVPGRMYVLTPVGPMGRIVSSNVLDGDDVVGAVHCQDNGETEYTIGELSFAMSGGKRRRTVKKRMVYSRRRKASRKQNGKN